MKSIALWSEAFSKPAKVWIECWQKAQDCRVLKRADLIESSRIKQGWLSFCWWGLMKLGRMTPKREVSWSQGLWNWTSLLHTERSWTQVETTNNYQSCRWPYRLYPDPFSFFVVLPAEYQDLFLLVCTPTFLPVGIALEQSVNPMLL